MPSIPRRVCEKLKFYVYLYVDPRTQRPFYVGKGQNNRIYSHLDDTEDCEKVKRIVELRKLGMDELTNRVKGHGAAENGRARLTEIIQELDAEEVTISDKVILINISRLYRYGMTPIELYDATRGGWKVAPHRHSPDFAFSVHGGIVREAYSIAAWVPANSTMTGRDFLEKEYDLSERYEFVGKVAPESIRKKYLGKSIRIYFSPGSQNPIKYVNC